jgi:hypothetical protein
MANNRTIRVRGIQDVQRSLKRLGMTARQSRTSINKALRPAANKLARGIQSAYKREFNTYSGMKSGRTPTWKTIGIITARKSRQPGLFVGPIVRKTTPIRIKGGDSRNLAAMQIKGNAIQDPRPDVFQATARKMESQIYVQAEKDIDRLLDKMIKQAGF